MYDVIGAVVLTATLQDLPWMERSWRGSRFQAGLHISDVSSWGSEGAIYRDRETEGGGHWGGGGSQKGSRGSVAKGKGYRPHLCHLGAWCFLQTLVLVDLVSSTRDLRMVPRRKLIFLSLHRICLQNIQMLASQCEMCFS